MKGLYNNQGRKSGGYPKSKINVSRLSHVLYNLSIQCFEGRHQECMQEVTLFNPSGKCECRHHIT